MFDIDGFEPEWLSGASAICARHAERLRSLTGRQLTRALVVWDASDDSWFADAPVVLDFDGVQLEVCHSKFDELSITWNTINVAAPIRWESEGAYPLSWRGDALDERTALVGGRLEEAALLEWSGPSADLANGMVAVNLRLTSGEVTIANGMDENQLVFGPPGDNYRQIPVR